MEEKGMKAFKNWSQSRSEKKKEKEAKWRKQTEEEQKTKEAVLQRRKTEEQDHFILTSSQRNETFRKSDTHLLEVKDNGEQKNKDEELKREDKGKTEESLIDKAYDEVLKLEHEIKGEKVYEGKDQNTNEKSSEKSDEKSSEKKAKMNKLREVSMKFKKTFFEKKRSSSSSEEEWEWGITGPTGPTGPEGCQGPPGESCDLGLPTAPAYPFPDCMVCGVDDDGSKGHTGCPVLPDVYFVLCVRPDGTNDWVEIMLPEK